MEVAALVLLLVGGLIVPLFGWMIGVILLWLSNAWNVRDKVIGTIFVPGGLGLPLIGFVLFATGSDSGTCISDLKNPNMVACTGEGTSAGDVITVVGLIALLIAPLVTTAYLAYRLRHQPAAATA